jgi:PAS domain S-box-containing protein
MGVLELASFHSIEPYQIAFLEKLAESIASAIGAAQTAEQTRVLLSQSQQLTEELRAQEEEIRQNMEEMAATQEEIRRQSLELEAMSVAVNSTLATISFDPQGNILSANENFLQAMGYTLDAIKTRHHRMFLDTDDFNQTSYDQFWQQLRAGQPQIGQVRRLTSRGEDIWLSASYTPVFNSENQVIKVIKFAQDITAQKKLNLDFERQLQAINRSFAVIEFDPTGIIVSANENFLELMGYTLDQIQGNHHRLFVTQEESCSNEYSVFWQKLAAGQALSGEFDRLTQSGQRVRIKGSYNPILDLKGKTYKVVKYAQLVRQSV